MVFRCFLILVLIMMVFSSPHKAAQIQTITPLKPYSTNQNYTTEYIFNIFIPSSIPTNASIEIELPSSFTEPSFCIAYINPPNGSYSKYKCEINHSLLLIHIGIITPGNYELLVESIPNPLIEEPSAFKIRTYMNGIILVDQSENIGSIEFLPPPSNFFCLNFCLFWYSIHRKCIRPQSGEL